MRQEVEIPVLCLLGIDWVWIRASGVNTKFIRLTTHQPCSYLVFTYINWLTRLLYLITTVRVMRYVPSANKILINNINSETYFTDLLSSRTKITQNYNPTLLVPLLLVSACLLVLINSLHAPHPNGQCINSRRWQWKIFINL